VTLVDEGQHVAAHPPIALVPVLLGTHPLGVLHVVGNDERGSVLAVIEAAYLPATGSNAHPIVEDVDSRLPVLVAVQRWFRPAVVWTLVVQVASF